MPLPIEDAASFSGPSTASLAAPRIGSVTASQASPTGLPMFSASPTTPAGERPMQGRAVAFACGGSGSASGAATARIPTTTRSATLWSDRIRAHPLDQVDQLEPFAARPGRDQLRRRAECCPGGGDLPVTFDPLENRATRAEIGARLRGRRVAADREAPGADDRPVRGVGEEPVVDRHSEVDRRRAFPNPDA